MNILILIHSPFETWNIPVPYVERLRRDFPNHTFHHARDDAGARGVLGEIEAAFSSQIHRHLLAAAPRLRWIHSPAAGVGGMLYPAMLQRDVVITNSRGMSSDTIAEHVLAVTLALFRRLPLAVRRQAERAWAQDEISAPPSNRTIAGSEVLIVGLGAIGKATAARMAALGARVRGVRRRVPDRADEDGIPVFPATDLPALLGTADVVVIAAPQTKDTMRLIDEGALSRMKREAIVVNVSRGRLVDERALAQALAAGTIAGAALDVFEAEPLPPDNPLWTAPNVLITPHTSGFRVDHWEAATSLFSENLRRLDRGEPLLNVVDKAAGY